VASKSLVLWLKMLWENWRASVRCDLTRVVFCWILSLVSPAAGGFVLLL
jgi:hypothetical protein